MDGSIKLNGWSVYDLSIRNFKLCSLGVPVLPHKYNYACLCMAGCSAHWKHCKLLK